MNIGSISGNSFGVLFMMPAPQINVVPVPAIVRSVDKIQLKSAERMLPKFNLRSIPLRNSGSPRDTFILHEAIVPDTKIRVVGAMDKKYSDTTYMPKLKGPGRRHVVSIWKHN